MQHESSIIRQYNRKLIYFRKSGSQRNWLSLNSSTITLLCWVCLAFSNDNVGFGAVWSNSSVKHIYTRSEEHEKMKAHILSSETYVMHKENRGVDKKGKGKVFSVLN
jgi:hypothetical protein